MTPRGLLLFIAAATIKRIAEDPNREVPTHINPGRSCCVGSQIPVLCLDEALAAQVRRPKYRTARADGPNESNVKPGTGYGQKASFGPKGRLGWWFG